MKLKSVCLFFLGFMITFTKSDDFDEKFKIDMLRVSRVQSSSIFSLGTEEGNVESEFSEKSKMKPIRKKNSPLFRSAVKKARKLDAKVHRWEHKVKIIHDEPDGCGYPVCVVLEARVKRFKSLCHLFKYMNDTLLQKTVIQVQKGSCEDAIEGKRHHDPWGVVPTHCQGSANDYKYGCYQQICIHIGNAARTFSSVCEAMKWLGPKKDVIKIAVGLGPCKILYSQCIYTDWFDLEDPCHKGDYEHYDGIKNMFIDTGNGIQNFCPRGFLDGPMQGVTLNGQDQPKNITFQVFQDDLALQCLNSAQGYRAKPPYYWNNEEVRCRDFKVRFCCKLLYGTPVAVWDKNTVEAVSVDSPDLSGKTLFDKCEWRGFISSDYALKRGDIETRAVHVKYRKTSACGSTTRSYAMIIDARKRSDDTPADETGEIITKNTPWFGFYCDNINNKIFNKKCSDYKVRYCCAKKVFRAAQWGDWSDYSSCTKKCGGGSQFRTRDCIKKRGNKQNCFGYLKKRFSRQERACNILPCPKDLQWGEWSAWTSCSASCDEGTRHRVRACYPPTNGGKNCPPPGDQKYKDVGSCLTRKCPDPQWTKWSSWTSCSKTCNVGLRTRERVCVDVKNSNSFVHDCPGPKKHQESCFEKYCPIDGGWTVWQKWGECNRACGKDGKRPRRRYCVQPFPENGGKPCPGISVEYGPCEHLRPCPVHCKFSEWGSWSDCSVTCGSSPGAGQMTRYRHIAQPAQYGGIKCSGILKEVKACTHCNFTQHIKEEEKTKCIPFCPIDCVWEEWGQISGKCVACWGDGPGHFPKAVAKLRNRKKTRYIWTPPAYNGKDCLLSNGKPRGPHQFQEDIVVPCKVSHEVEPSSPTEYGGHEYDTYKCVKQKKKSKVYFEIWSMWSFCDAVCGKDGTQKRTRKCRGGSVAECESHHGLKHIQTRPCPSICPPPEWTPWENWSKCEVTCGKGQIARRRTCLANDREKKFKKSSITCEGIQREQRKCDMGPCGSIHKLVYEGADQTGISGQSEGAYKSAPVDPNQQETSPPPEIEENRQAPSEPSVPSGESENNTNSTQDKPPGVNKEYFPKVPEANAKTTDPMRGPQDYSYGAYASPASSLLSSEDSDESLFKSQEFSSWASV